MNTIRLEKLTKNSLTKEILEAYKRRTNKTIKTRREEGSKASVIEWRYKNFNICELILSK